MKNFKKIVSMVMVTMVIVTSSPTCEVEAAKLKKPKKMVVKSVTSKHNSITVKWKKQPSSRKIKKYYVQIKGGKTYKVSKNKSSKTIKGLVAGETYKVRVRAKNSKGYGKWSKYKKITTKAYNVIPLPEVVDDTEIKTLATTNANVKNVNIFIHSYDLSADYLVLKYNENTKQFEKIATVDHNDPQFKNVGGPILYGYKYSDANVELNNVYYYKVVRVTDTAEQIEQAKIIAAMTSDSKSYVSEEV